MKPSYRRVTILRGEQQVAELQLFMAFNVWQRARGLLARPLPDPGYGLWLKPCSAVHCWFMGYAIDVLFLDAQGRVIKICSALKPWRMAACPGARSVIELAAGETQRLSIKEGDQCICAF
ncbi:MAG: DUF192 domain-containing protein [Pseudomonas sp.]|nr:DUF192 domain-containing protein [Pseudomonas sp.]